MVTPKLKDFVWRMLTNSLSPIKSWKLSELISHMKLNSMNSASKDCKSNLMKFQFFHKTGDIKNSHFQKEHLFGIMYHVCLVIQKWIRDEFCKVEILHKCTLCNKDWWLETHIYSISSIFDKFWQILTTLEQTIWLWNHI